MLSNTCSVCFVSDPPALDLVRHALFLDLDGTLVDIAEHHDEVVAEDDLLALLKRLPSAFSGAVALITGRTIDGADRLLAHAFANIAGLHGLEHRLGGVRERDARATADIEAARADVAALDVPVRIEDKGASLALHYRHAPKAETAICAAAEDIAARHGLRTLRGKMVIEIVAGAHTKGDALRAFMRSPPFVGRIPVAVGDDVTDEDAFAAAIAAGGFAVAVGERASDNARYRLEAPAAVISWLRGAIGPAA